MIPVGGEREAEPPKIGFPAMGEEKTVKKSDWFGRRGVPTFFFLIGLAAGMIRTVRPFPAITGDTAHYLFQASALLSGDFLKGINYFYPPLFPAAVVLIDRWIPDLENAGRAAALLANALTVFPIYGLAWRLFSPRAAVFSAAVFAVGFQTAPGREAEAVMLFLFTLSLWTGYRGLWGGRSVWFFLTGLVWGAAFLALSETQIFFIFFLLLTALLRLGAAFRSRRGRRAKEQTAAVSPEESGAPAGGFGARRWTYATILMIFAYLLFAAPYLAVHFVNTNQLSFNPRARALFLARYFLTERMDRLEEDSQGTYTPAQRIFQEGGRRPLKQNPLSELAKYPERFFASYGRSLLISLPQNAAHDLQMILPWLWLLFLIVGLWPGGDRDPRRFYLHAFALVSLLGVPLFSTEGGILYTLLPWAVMMIGRGGARTVELLASFMTKRWEMEKRTIALAGSLMFLGTVFLLGGIRLVGARPTVESQEAAFRRDLASTLKLRLNEGCRFLAAREALPLWYIADVSPSRQVTLPDADLDRLLKYAEETEAKFLVFHQGVAPRYPGLKVLLEEDFFSHRLTLVSRRKSPGGETFVIYELPQVECGMQTGTKP